MSTKHPYLKLFADILVRGAILTIAIIVCIVVFVAICFGLTIIFPKLTMTDINDSLDRFSQFLRLVFANVVAISILVIAYYTIIKNVSITNRSYNYISIMQREAYTMLLKGELTPEQILEKLRNMRFGFLKATGETKRENEAIDLAMSVFGNDYLMMKYVITMTFNRESYKELKEEIAELKTEDGETKESEINEIATKERRDIKASLNKILKNKTLENRKHIEGLLASWMEKPFKTQRELATISEKNGALGRISHSYITTSSVKKSFMRKPHMPTF